MTDRRGVLGLAIAVLAAFALRLLPLPRVLSIAYVDFQGDGWYHLRRLDWLLANFPAGLTFDPYVGQYVPLPPLFDLLVAGIVSLAGLPAPGSRPAEVMAAVAPALLGALVALPVYAHARLMFGAKAALWAALLVGLLPGPFLIRSLAGATDHHVAEVLFSSLALFLVARSACEPGSRSPLLAGLALGAYFLCWSGAPFLVAGLLAWGAVEYTRALLRGGGVAAISRALGPAAALALCLVLLFQPVGLLRYSSHTSSLTLLLALVLAAEAADRVPRLIGRPRARVWLWASIAAIALVVAVREPRFRTLVEEAHGVFAGTGAATVGETRPLLRMAGEPSFRPVVELFGTGFLGLLVLPVIAWRAAREPRPDLSLLALWSLIALLATLGRNRFGYYLVPCLALLLAWPCAALFEAARRGRAHVRVAAAIGLLALLLPNAPLALSHTLVNEGIPVAWHQALAWLRSASVEPFGDPSYYVARYEQPRIPESRILAWWDYGYWIARVARRVPVATPTQTGADAAGRMLTATDDSETGKLLADFKVSHVVVNDELPFRLGSPELIGKFATLADWGGSPVGRYVEVLYERDSGVLRPVWVFHPAYYQSLAVHLYLFGGEATRSEEAWVIRYRLAQGDAGRTIREIVEAKRSSFEEALALSRSLGNAPHLLVGRDPTRPCVPLRKRAGFRLAYESSDADRGPFGRPSVRVFERVAGAE